MKEHASTSRKAGRGANSIRKQRARPVAKGGNDPLTTKIAGIKKLLIEADKQDLAVRYKIAVECQEILAGDGKGKVYGAGAARKLGKALGWSKTAVYAYVAVAATWNEKRFRELADKRDTFGRPFSWSHIMVLAAVKDAQQRHALTKQTIDNGSSVRELKGAIAGNPPKAAKATGTEEAKPPRPLTAAIANYATGVRTAKDNADVFGAAIMKQVENAESADLKPGLLEQLKKARTDLEIHYQTESKRLDTLIQLIESGKHAPSAVDAEADARRPKGTRK